MIHINLLPGAQKRKLRQELIKTLSIAFSFFLLTVIGLGIVISVVFSQKLAVSANMSSVQKQIDEKQNAIKQYESTINEASLLSTKLLAINDVLAKTNRWSIFFNNLAASVPSSGAQFVGISIADDLNLNITGIADNSIELAKLLSTMRRAVETTSYDLKTTDTLASLAIANKVDAQLILLTNKVGSEADLIKLQTIKIPQLLFDSVEISSVSLQKSETSNKEVDKKVSFTLSIILKESAIR
jgi:Tfp pilus assembly protein PilN